MKLLLDTHILLWALVDDERLPRQARRLIVDAQNEVYYSVVCPWEVQIKHQLHPESLAIDASELVSYCREAGYLHLLLKQSHVLALGSLEREEGAPPHRDPFERIMICQASVENMLFITHDARLADYTDSCVFFV